jgi:hypothetical protein
VVPPDDDRRLHGARPDELVERESGFRALAVPEPADPGRQPLERHLLLGHPEPAVERGLVGEELDERLVRPEDVRRVARQRDPPERPGALAEERADERGHEAGEVEGIDHPCLLRLRPDVVPVVEDDRALPLEGEHRPDLVGHRAHGAPDVRLGLGGPEHERIVERDLGGDIAVERVVGGGLVRDDIEALALRGPRRLDLRGVPHERDRQGLPSRGRQAGEREGGIGRVGHLVHVADLVATACPGLVHLDAERNALVHRHRERLGAAHPAEARGEHDAPAQRPTEVLPRALAERLVRALEDPLGPDVDPGAGRHLAVHHQAGPLELAEMLPVRPLPDEVRVRDEDARGPRMRPEDAHRLARLDEERLVVRQPPQLPDDRVERLPAARRAAGAAVHDEAVRVLRDLRV